MDIISGISALRTAADLTKTLRDAAKSGALKPDEFAGRVGEIYDYIIDSRAALVDAQDEMRALQSKLESFDIRKQIDTELEHDGYVFWRNHPDGSKTGPYCVFCWTKQDTLVPLTHIAGTWGGSHPSKRFDCVEHGTFMVPHG